LICDKLACYITLSEIVFTMTFSYIQFNSTIFSPAASTLYYFNKQFQKMTKPKAHWLMDYLVIDYCSWQWSTTLQYLYHVASTVYWCSHSIPHMAQHSMARCVKCNKNTWNLAQARFDVSSTCCVQQVSLIELSEFWPEYIRCWSKDLTVLYKSDYYYNYYY